ncbi:MAG TPA: DUF998 domain-containing protein [Pseudonocardiaceae bacterium]
MTSISTRTLLTSAVLSAPLFAVVSLTQAFTRAGFDLTRYPLSALSNGSLGWLQITNFLLSGALTIVGATGLRRVLRGTPGGIWVPRLVRAYGIGYMLAGVFRMDPGGGFPVGAPTPSTMSWHSDLHMLAGSVSFACLIAACFVLGRHYTRAGRRGFAIASRVFGVAAAAGNVWAMIGGTAGSLTLCVGVVSAMLWVSLVASTKLSQPVQGDVHVAQHRDVTVVGAQPQL